MFDKVEVYLPSEERKKFYYRTLRMKVLAKEISKLVDIMKCKKINMRELFLIPEDFKLEKDISIEDQDEMIESIKNSTYPNKEKIRFINLYLGMKFILDNKDITEENLKSLYQIITKDITTPEEGMGEFYRNTREFVYHSDPIFPEYTETVKPDNVKEFMDQLLEFIKKDEDQSDINLFIKSQLIHLYFVYVHPYSDGNGRSARLVSSWFLLNHELAPYLLFNKAITNNKDAYRKSVRKSIESKDMTHYLYFIMSELKKELIQVCTLDDLNKKLDKSLSKVERQIVESLLTLKEASLNVLLEYHTRYNPGANKKEILKNQIFPLIERGIIIEENGVLRLKQQEKKQKHYGG